MSLSHWYDAQPENGGYASYVDVVRMLWHRTRRNHARWAEAFDKHHIAIGRILALHPVENAARIASHDRYYAECVALRATEDADG